MVAKKPRADRQHVAAAKTKSVKAHAPQKNSLVANINRRKKAGTSRSKSRSTISRAAYRELKAGWK